MKLKIVRGSFGDFPYGNLDFDVRILKPGERIVIR